MGMLVTGSIISPRIFISTSIMVPSRRCLTLDTRLAYETQTLSGFLDGHLPQKAVGKSLRNLYSYILSDARLRSAVDHEVERLVLRSAARDLSAGWILSLHHDFNNLP